MDMKIMKSEKRLCPCCMEEHEVKTVLVEETATFKNSKVDYEASYLFCENAEELYMEESQIQENDIRLKNAYRRKQGLLTSEEIVAIRLKYGITQSDLCVLLGWGAKTITRYESHQVQDRAHDTILRKIGQDPEWFLVLLADAKEHFPETAYKKYFEAATQLYEKNKDIYLKKAIEADYAGYAGNKMLHGNVELSLDKVVDVICYFAASSKIRNLYKVKLMKLLWYADALSYKRRDFAMTGLVYQALPMGAVPVGHNAIIDLKDVPCEEVDMGEGNGYYFSLSEPTTYKTLTEDDVKILDAVIEKLGSMSKTEIVAFMYKEEAYEKTTFKDIISFEYAKHLQIE